MNLSKSTESHKFSIFFNGACLSIPSQIDGSVTKKIEMCQLKLDNKEKISVLLKEINRELNIYNTLFNDIYTIYDRINEITPFTYQQNFYDKFKNLNNRYYDAYLLSLILIIEILFFKPSIKYLIDITKEYIQMYRIRKQKQVTDFISKFSNFKFYELIFKIFFEYNNINICGNIYKYFKDIFNLINTDFLDNYDGNKQDHYEALEKIINSYPLESQEYEKYRNILIYSINYFYINNILDLKKIEEKKSSMDVLSTDILEKKGEKFIIKNEFLNDKLKDLKIDLGLYKLNIQSLKDDDGKHILPASIKSVDQQFIYTLVENYDNTIKELFDLYYNL